MRGGSVSGKAIPLQYARPKPPRRIPLLALIFIVLYILGTIGLILFVACE